MAGLAQTGTIHIPRPHANESPVGYANRIAQWYLEWNGGKKQLGQFFTSTEVAYFMAQLCARTGDFMRVLDPGAGTGILACALCETLKCDIYLEAYETDPELAGCLEHSLDYAQRWMHAHGLNLRFKVVPSDFVMARAWALDWSVNEYFDVAILNPPYFKLSKSDPRAKAALSIVHGQPNIYAIFMGISAALLKPGGQLVCITPRSYAAGQYFHRFREYFFGRMRPRTIHLFDSRRDVFDNVLQESVILLAERSTQDSDVEISLSNSDQDFAARTRRILPFAQVLSNENVLHIPSSEKQDQVAKIVRSWNFRLRDFGMEVSTGPVVPFRAKSLIVSTGDVPTSHVPLLWMQNISPMTINWPLRRKSQYMTLDGAAKLLLPNRNYVLVRRFSAKEEQKRLVASPYLAEIDTPLVGLENHLNYIYRPNGLLNVEEVRGLAALLNSELVDNYFRIFSGNTQVSATELRAMPMPSLESITEIGRRLTEYSDVNLIIEDVLGVYGDSK